MIIRSRYSPACLSHCGLVFVISTNFNSVNPSPSVKPYAYNKDQRPLSHSSSWSCFWRRKEMSEELFSLRAILSISRRALM